MSSRALLAAFLCWLFGGLPVAMAAETIPDYVTAAVQDPGRPPWDIARDGARKPDVVLAFSGIKPGNVVAELLPNDGYYTRILSRLVGPAGRVYAIAPMQSGYRDFEAILEENKKLIKEGKEPNANPVADALAIQNISEYSNVTAMLEMLWQFNGQFSVPEQLDAVFADGGYHDLHLDMLGVADKVANVNKAIFASLKPGGTYMIVDHASASGVGFAKSAPLHRSDPNAVKAELTAVGFVFDGASDALAKPNDDHTQMANNPATRDQMDSIVLRFTKPATASAATLRPPKGSFDGYYGNTNIMNHGNLANTPRQERRMFYHADGTYQEFGIAASNAPMQSGLWYWDAAGHNCMLHQYPAPQRGFIVCHASVPGKYVGDNWTQPQVVGNTGVPPTPFTMLPGYQPFVEPAKQ